MDQPVFFPRTLEAVNYLGNICAMSREFINTGDIKCFQRVMFSSCYMVVTLPNIGIHTGAHYTLGRLIKYVDDELSVHLRKLIMYFITLAIGNLSDRDFKELLLFENWVPVCNLLGLPVSLVYSTVIFRALRVLSIQRPALLYNLSSEVIRNEDYHNDVTYFTKMKELIRFEK